jgi:hypothetical protein
MFPNREIFIFFSLVLSGADACEGWGWWHDSRDWGGGGYWVGYRGKSKKEILAGGPG